MVKGREFIHCAIPNCPAKIKDHAWGHIQASDWFFSQKEDRAFCPDHIPEWVEAWRARKKLEREL